MTPVACTRNTFDPSTRVEGTSDDEVCRLGAVIGWTLSISIPRNVRRVDGPSDLWAGIGTPRRSHSRYAMSMRALHAAVSG